MKERLSLVLSWGGYVLTLVAFAIPLIWPEWTVAAGALMLLSATLLLALRERQRRDRAELARRLLALGGSVENLDRKIDYQRPTHHSSAGIIGQGELATWNYSELIARLQQDGYIS